MPGIAAAGMQNHLSVIRLSVALISLSDFCDKLRFRLFAGGSGKNVLVII